MGMFLILGLCYLTGKNLLYNWVLKNKKPPSGQFQNEWPLGGYTLL